MLTVNIYLVLSLDSEIKPASFNIIKIKHDCSIISSSSPLEDSRHTIRYIMR